MPAMPEMPDCSRPFASFRLRGVTRVESFVAGGLMLALAGVIAPVSGLPGKDEQVASIVALCKTLERASFRHFVDTGETATEFSGHDGEVAKYHRLSHSQGDPRWNGPYLDAPLSSDANPCGGEVWLYPDLRGGVASPGGGFDPKQSGRDSVTGAGQFVAFSGVPEDVASLVDRELDGTPGEYGWRSTGRCEYDRVTRTLSILVLELP